MHLAMMASQGAHTLQTGKSCIYTHPRTHTVWTGARRDTSVCFMCIHSCTRPHKHTRTVCTSKTPNSTPCYFCSFRINLMDRMSGGITTDWWNLETKCSTERDTLHCITQGTSAHTHRYTKTTTVAKHTHTCMKKHSERQTLLCILTIWIAYA